MNSIGDSCSVGTLYAGQVNLTQTRVYGSVGSPLSGTPVKIDGTVDFASGITRYVAFITVPAGGSGSTQSVFLGLGVPSFQPFSAGWTCKCSVMLLDNTAFPALFSQVVGNETNTIGATNMGGIITTLQTTQVLASNETVKILWEFAKDTY